MLYSIQKISIGLDQKTTLKNLFTQEASSVPMQSAFFLDGTDELHINRKFFFKYYTNSQYYTDQKIMPHHIIIHNTTVYLLQNFHIDYFQTFAQLLKLYELFRLDEEVY